MVAVQVTDEDLIDHRRIEVVAFHRRERARPTIEEAGGVGRLHEIAGLVIPTGGEGVARAEEGHAHRLGHGGVTLPGRRGG